MVVVVVVVAGAAEGGRWMGTGFGGWGQGLADLSEEAGGRARRAEG